jgi:hypothetical protein
LKQILRTIDADLGPILIEQHHLIGEGDLVAQHVTLRGTHRSATATTYLSCWRSTQQS